MRVETINPRGLDAEPMLKVEEIQRGTAGRLAKANELLSMKRASAGVLQHLLVISKKLTRTHAMYRGTRVYIHIVYSACFVVLCVLFCCIALRCVVSCCVDAM